MSRKTKQRPTLEGVYAKHARACFHLAALQREFYERVENDAYTFAGEVRPGGLEHIYRPVNPPPVADHWSAVVGDALHNLRSALDHLADQLVRLNGGSPNKRTQFPVLLRPSRWNPCTNCSEPAVPRVGGGISAAAQAVIEEIQPYKGTETGQWLARLHELNVIDKHRRFVIATTGLLHARTMREVHDSAPPTAEKIIAVGEQLVDGEVCAKVIYPTPYDELDPNLEWDVTLRLARDEPCGSEPLFKILGMLNFWIGDGVIRRLAPLFEGKAPLPLLT